MGSLEVFRNDLDLSQKQGCCLDDFGGIRHAFEIGGREFLEITKLNPSSRNNMIKYMYSMYYCLYMYTYSYVYLYSERFKTSFTKLEMRLQTFKNFKTS